MKLCAKQSSETRNITVPVQLTIGRLSLEQAKVRLSQSCVTKSCLLFSKLSVSPQTTPATHLTGRINPPQQVCGCDIYWLTLSSVGGDEKASAGLASPS